jgi:hypothetical protein
VKPEEHWRSQWHTQPVPPSRSEPCGHVLLDVDHLPLDREQMLN